MKKVNTAYPLPSLGARLVAPLMAVATLSTAHGVQVGEPSTVYAAVSAAVLSVVVDRIWLGPALDKMGYSHGYKLRELALGAANFGIGVMATLTFLR